LGVMEECLMEMERHKWATRAIYEIK
jgi:hypothetical protein